LKALVYHGPGDLRIENVNSPMLEDGDALLEVSYCGLCGTDVKTYRRGHHMFTPPCILGHEVVGKIVEIKGKSGRPDINVGDKVAVAPYVPCYSCVYCRKGREELCINKGWIEGAFAEFVRIPAEVLNKGTFHIRLDEHFKLACLAEPLACCVNAVEDSNVKLADTVMIIGAGPMGLLMLELCKTMGASKILVSEPNELRRNKAAESGAFVMGSQDEDADVSQWIKDETGGVGADVVFVCVGTPLMSKTSVITGFICCLATILRSLGQSIGLALAESLAPPWLKAWLRLGLVLAQLWLSPGSALRLDMFVNITPSVLLSAPQTLCNCQPGSGIYC
jgi:L-iditol 2-dehydrogenase